MGMKTERSMQDNIAGSIEALTRAGKAAEHGVLS